VIWKGQDQAKAVAALTAASASMITAAARVFPP